MANNIVWVAFACALTEFICYGGDWAFAQVMTDQPIVVGPLIGLMLGDLKTGLILGAMLEATFIGAVNVGGAISLNPSVGTVLATAYAIVAGGSTKEAVALAVPLGLLGGMLEIGMNSLCALFGNSWDKAADEGNEKKLVALHWGVWFFKMFIISLVIFLVVLIGIKPVAAGVKALPAFVENGLALTGGLLPAVGFAMLLSMVWESKLCVWYFFGFVLVEYLNLPLLAAGVLGLVFVVTFAFYDKDILDAKKSGGSGSAQPETSEEEEEDFLS